MVEKLSVDSRNSRNMKTNKKGSRGSMSSRHGKSTKVQNNSFGGFGGGSNSLNWRNEIPKGNSNAANAVSESNNYGYSNHYVANAFYSLIGLQVEIQKKDAIIYEGILETVSSKVEFHLSHVCEKSNINGTKSEKMAKKLIFPFSDVVYCRAPNVDTEFAKRDTLLTDSAISNSTNNGYTERELVQWMPDDNNGDTTFHELGDHDSPMGWAFDDMMRVNEEEHGVKSTFDSSMSSYMTPLDKGNEEEFKACERRAEQVARAIQKDPGFKDVDNVDSGIGEEDMFSSVSRNSNNYNMNNNNINDGFTTYTGKNYRGGRHATSPANVVGPRLQRNHNNIRTQDGGPNHNMLPHQSNRNNHISSPQRTQNTNPSRNNSYQQQPVNPQQPKHHQQAPSTYQRTSEHQKVVVAVPNTAANTARVGLSYSAVAMKKDPPPPVANNRVPPPNPSTKQSAPPGLPEVVQPPPQDELPVPPQSVQLQTPADEQPPPSSQPLAGPVPVVGAPPSVEAATTSPLPLPVSGEQVTEALAAAKQQMIQEARKKAGMGLTAETVVPAAAPQTVVSLVSTVSTVVTTTTLSTAAEVTATVVTSTTIASPARQPAVTQAPTKPVAVPIVMPTLQPVEKPVSAPPVRQSNGKVEALEKGVANMEIKSEVQASVVASLKEPRIIRGEENKQPAFLMKYGKVQQNVAEEKKLGSYKELKEFGEQFKLESKPKKRSPKTTEQPTKVPAEAAPAKAPEVTTAEVKSKETESQAKTQISTVVSTTTSVTVVSSVSSTTPATVTSTVTTSTSEEAASSPSRKSSLNPSAKEFTLSATAKEFNPGRESSSPFTPSPKQSPARPGSSSNGPSQGPHPHQPYYPGNQQGAVMIHPNGPEVISPTVQSVPKIYARPYMAPGPGGSTTIQYSIPAVPFNNNSSGGPQIIAAPQSAGFLSQNPTGQQMIIIHPNEPYQSIVQPGQPGQQYYPMQQMIRCVPSHPNNNSVQQGVAAARVPGNFQQQDGSPGYVLTAVSQHGGLVQHPGTPGHTANQHQNYHGGPPQSPGQSSHIQTQYAITHPSPSSYLQNPQSPAQHTQQGNSGPGGAFRSPASMHSAAAGQHHPQQPFVMVAHHGQHMQTVALPNNQTYVQGQQYGGGILQNYTQN